MKILLSELAEKKKEIIKENPNPNYPNNANKLGFSLIKEIIKNNYNDWLEKDLFKTLTYSDRYSYEDFLKYFIENNDIKEYKESFSNLNEKEKFMLLRMFYNERLDIDKKFKLIDYLYQECGFKSVINNYTDYGYTMPMEQYDKKNIQHIVDNGYDLSIVKKEFTSADLIEMNKNGWIRNGNDLKEMNKNSGLTAYELAVKLNSKTKLEILKPKISYEDEEKKLLNLLSLPTKKAFKEFIVMLKQKNKAIKNNIHLLTDIIKEKESRSKKTIIHYLIDFNETALLIDFINLNIFDKNDLVSKNTDYLFYCVTKMRPKGFDIILEKSFYNVTKMRENFATHFEHLKDGVSYIDISEKTIKKLKDKGIPLSKYDLHLIYYNELDSKIPINTNKQDKIKKL